MGELNISHKFAGEVSVGLIAGRLDLQGANKLEAYAQEHLSAGESRLVLNLAGVDYISSAGLRSLLVVAKKVQAVNGCLVLCSLPVIVLNIMNISGFQQLLKICASEEEGIATAAGAGN